MGELVMRSITPSYLQSVLVGMMLCLSIAPYDPAQTASPSANIPDLKGTWSGTFFSSQGFSPFTLTVVITPNSRGHLTGDSSLNSECLKSTRFDVTVQRSTVVLAGGDEEGDNLTLRGNLDSSGAMIDAKYILNASATGRCETDNGSGSLAKR